MLRKTLLFSLSAILFFPAKSQIAFEKTFHYGVYGNYNWGNGAYGVESKDGGYLVTTSVNDTSGGTNMFLLKLNIYGDSLWKKEISIPFYMEDPRSVVSTSGGKYTIQGTYNVPGTNYDDEIFLSQVDNNGNLIYYKNLTSSGICCWDYSTGKIIETSDNGYLLSGQNFGISSGFGRIMKTDSSGNSQWQGNFGSYYRTQRSIKTTDGGYLLGGYNLTGSKNAAYEKWTAGGIYSWGKNFVHPKTLSGTANYVQGISELFDGYLIAINYADSFGNNLWLLKTNLTGDTMWTKNYAGEGGILDMLRTNDGGFVFAGNATNTSTGVDYKIMKMDSSCNIVSIRYYGTAQTDQLYSFEKTSDGGYFLSGMSGPPGVYNHDIYAVKTDSNGCLVPVADFARDTAIQFGTDTIGVAFIDRSSFGIISPGNLWHWDFGDGSTDTVQNQAHIYSVQGNYVVQLIISSECGSDTISQLVTATCSGNPYSFSYSDSLMYAYFDDLSGSDTAWYWDFGDGTSDTTKNPSHIYSAPGNYLVCLTTTNSCGTVNLCDTIYIVCSPPVVDLGAEQFLCTGNLVMLNAGNYGKYYLWSTGDTASTITPDSTANYFVTVTNMCSASTVDSVKLNFSPLPIISSGNDTVVCHKDTVTFVNITGVNSYNFNWIFDGTASGTDSSFTYIFGTLASHSLVLIANNNGCIDSSKIYIGVSPIATCNPGSISYCIPAPSTGTNGGDFIKLVSIGSINNSTGATGGPSYNNYTNLSANLNAGTNYGLTSSYTFSHSMRYEAWIDYNMDGIFDDTQELLFGNVVNGGTSTNYFTLPSNLYGGVTRLRIRCADASQSQMNPCTNFIYGETEDYSVNIIPVCPSIMVNETITNTACSVNNGAIFISVTGGAAPYAYNWSNGGTGTSLTNLSSGNYTVTVTDYKGCSAVKTFSVLQPVFNIAETVSNILCNGGTGAISIVVSGGTSPYSYLWNTGATASQISNLAAQIYSVTITDNAGCIGSNSYTITEPSQLGISVISLTDAICPGAANGSATVSATGGTSPYAYYWSNGGTQPTISNLPAATYIVTVTDANACQQQTTFTIGVASPAALPLQEDFQGTAFPPSEWSINNPDGSFSWQKYTPVTGSNGNQTATAYINTYSYSSVGEIDELLTKTISLPASGHPYLTFDISKAGFNTYNDSLKILISDNCGTSYTAVYNKCDACAVPNNLMTAGYTSSNYSPLSMGDWRRDSLDLLLYAGDTVIIKFVFINGYGNNIFIDNINVVDSAAPCSQTINQSANICQGDSIFLEGMYQTTAGTYYDTLTSIGGCDSIVTTSLTMELVVSITASADTVCIIDGGLTIITLGGTPPGGSFNGTAVQGEYFYADAAGAGTHLITYTYTDSNNCTGTDSVLLTVELCPGIYSYSNENFHVKVFPNPNDGEFIVRITNFYDFTNYEIKIYNILGEVVFHSRILNSETGIQIKGMRSGVYNLQLISAEGIITKRIIVE